MLTVGGGASIGGSAAITVGVIPSTGQILQSPSAVYASGDVLYVTSSSTNTLSIWDVSDPVDHALVGSTTAQLQGPRDVQVVGDLAYAVSEGHHRLAILDVSDPANPEARGSTAENLDHPIAVHVSGKYAFVASNGDPLDTARPDGLAVFDVTEPWTIVATSFITTYLDGTSDVFVSGNYAYVTSRDNDRLVVFDVSDPQDVVPVGYTTQSLAAPVGVHVSGIYAYVVSRDNDLVVVYNVSDPAQIEYVAELTALVSPRSIYVSGGRAYVAYAGEPGTGEQCGMAVLNISDPKAVGVVNTIDMTTWLMWVKGGTVEEPTWTQVPPKPVAVSGSGHRVYLANEWHDSVTIFEVDLLEAAVVRAGELGVAHLEVTDDATVSGDLAVRGGLNVGVGGALVQGGLSVVGPGDSYIQGRLGIGPVGTAITVGESITDYYQYTLLHPTHQLDVDGEARFRVNDTNHLVLRSRNTGADEDALIDFVDVTYPDLITPSARIEFDAADPLTHTTQIRFYTQGPDDALMEPRLLITQDGDLFPSDAGAYRLGAAYVPWLRVYAQEGFFTTSDARHKQNVSALPYGLDEVIALRPVTFVWIDQPDEETHYGLIAQEVREVLPEVVSIGEGEDGTLSIDYGELVPVLVKAVQQQQAEIEGQAAQITTLEARLAALEETQREGEAVPGVLGDVSTLGSGGLVLAALFFVVVRRKRERP
jgi:hypothetical protein